MIGYNLCYSTLVVREDEDKITSNANTTLTPIHRRFVLPSVRKGVIPQILEQLLAARKNVRAIQKATQDPFIRSVLEERQKALKISANVS
jgi:DNA polymerase delta subunit 1